MVVSTPKCNGKLYAVTNCLLQTVGVFDLDASNQTNAYMHSQERMGKVQFSLNQFKMILPRICNVFMQKVKHWQYARKRHNELTTLDYTYKISSPLFLLKARSQIVCVLVSTNLQTLQDETKLIFAAANIFHLGDSVSTLPLPSSKRKITILTHSHTYNCLLSIQHTDSVGNSCYLL